MACLCIRHEMQGNTIKTQEKRQIAVNSKSSSSVFLIISILLSLIKTSFSGSFKKHKDPLNLFSERRFRRQTEIDVSNSTKSHDDHSHDGEYYKDQLDLMEWLKGPLIVLGFIVVLSLCLFFLYIYKYRSEVGGRRPSMVSSQLTQLRRGTLPPPPSSP